MTKNKPPIRPHHPYLREAQKNKKARYCDKYKAWLTLKGCANLKCYECDVVGNERIEPEKEKPKKGRAITYGKDEKISTGQEKIRCCA